MKKLFLVFLLIILIGCTSVEETPLPTITPRPSSTPEPSITPTTDSLFQEPPIHFWTAKEAYREIVPHLLKWQSDAIVASVFSSSSRGETWRIQPNSRSAYWGFAVHSASSGSQTSIYLIDDQIIVGIDLKPGFEKTLSKVGQEVDFTSILDSDQVLPLAISMAVPDGYTAIKMYCRTDPHKPYPLAWTVHFVNISDPYDSYFIVLDPVTGEVIRNDFFLLKTKKTQLLTLRSPYQKRGSCPVS